MLTWKKTSTRNFPHVYFQRTKPQVNLPMYTDRASRCLLPVIYVNQIPYQDLDRGDISKPVGDTFLELQTDLLSNLASKHREPDDIRN